MEYPGVEEGYIDEIIESKQGFKVEEGKGKVLITAPHSVSQFREGKLKSGEYRTGLIAKMLNGLHGIPIGYKTRNLKDDANYDKECVFKEGIIEYILNNKIKVNIDIHIASSKRPFDVDIGTGNGNNIGSREDILKILKGGLEKEYEDVRVDDTFPASYPHTVTATVGRECGVIAFQLEINWRIIDDYDKVKKLVVVMNDVIEEIERTLDRGVTA